MERAKGTARKRLNLQALALVSLVTMAAGGGIALRAAEPPSDKGDRVVTGADLAFMNDAAPGGLAEVELSRLAVKRAESKEVRQFAERMIVDHGKAGQQLQALAEQKKVKLAAKLLPEAKQTEEKLSKLQGGEFDLAYVKVMVQVHQKDVAAFTAVAAHATDADVKAFARQTRPTLQHHLEMIEVLARKMNVPVK